MEPFGRNPVNNQEGLRQSNAERKKQARAKAKEAILSLQGSGQKVNFGTVATESGVSRHFLYTDSEIRLEIESLRNRDVNNDINRRAKFDKNAKSKDTILLAKDRRIAKLESENRKLKEELSVLRGLVYGTDNRLTAGTCTPREESSNYGG